MASLYDKYEKLCSPAQLYVWWSILGIVLSLLTILITGDNMKHVSIAIIVYAIMTAFTLGWTWLLNLICKDGHTDISWALVLVPHIIIMLGSLGLVLTKVVKFKQATAGISSAIFVAVGVSMMYNK
jgi:hypothetical protein